MEWLETSQGWESESGNYKIRKANGGYMLVSRLHDPSPDYPFADHWMRVFATVTKAKQHAEELNCEV